MKTNISISNGHHNQNDRNGKLSPPRAAVLVHQREDHVDVITVFIDRHWEIQTFEWIEHAMAAIQCPENHFVPAFIDGYPTIINAWLEGRAADQQERERDTDEEKAGRLQPLAATGA